jgi:hypothetical protein
LPKFFAVFYNVGIGACFKIETNSAFLSWMSFHSTPP